MSFDSQYAFNHFYEILQAAPVAVLVTVVSAFLGLFGGMLFCVVRLRRIPVLNTIVGLLVSLIRSTPILVQLYVVCYGMMWSVMECPVSWPSFIKIRSSSVT